MFSMGRGQRPRIGAVFAIQEVFVKQDAEAIEGLITPMQSAWI